MIVGKGSIFLLFLVYTLVGLYLLNSAFTFIEVPFVAALNTVFLVIGAVLLFWSAFKYFQLALMPGYGAAYGGYSY